MDINHIITAIKKRKKMINSIEFIRHLGIKQEGNSLTLEPKKELLNHLGSIHAGALFTLAESQSGLTLIEQFGETNVKALLRSSSIKYKTEAKSKLTATGTIKLEDIEKFNNQLNKKGRTLIEVTVKVVDLEENIVLTATFSWFVSI